MLACRFLKGRGNADDERFIESVEQSNSRGRLVQPEVAHGPYSSYVRSWHLGGVSERTAYSTTDWQLFSKAVVWHR